MITHFSFLYRLSPASALHGTAPDRARSWRAAARMVMVLPALIALSSGCCQNDIRKIPDIRGRVVEAKTGKPIVGARLARWFEREDGCLAPGGSDVHSVAGSLLTVTTGKDGSFEWPAWTSLTSPIKTMRWYIYHPDWVAEDGWFNHPRSGLHGYFFGISGVEPWLHLNSQPVGSHLEVTITMEPKDSAAAWEAHFQRVAELTRYGRLDAEYFVKEAARYAEGHELTASIFDRIYQVQQSLGDLEESGRYDQPEEALVLLSIQDDYCKRHEKERRCSPAYFEQRRAFLRQGLESNRKTTR